MEFVEIQEVENRASEQGCNRDGLRSLRGVPMIRVFIGYDSNETIAYHVLAHSILRHAKAPISVCPLRLSQLPMTRERAEYQSTEFSFSRFLVPYLCGFRGQAIFMDCDMLARADVSELLALHDPYKAVSVVKHEYVPRPEDKFLDRKSV